MDAWGCEYLDQYNNTPPPPTVHSNTFLVPMHILASVVDVKYLKEISTKDKAQIQALTADVAQRGILEPGKLVYDNSTVRLQDGNHRYLAAKALQLPEFPVTLLRVSKITAPGASLESVFLHLVLATVPRR